MRNKHYKSYSFRLNDPVINKIREIKNSTGKSYNLTFSDLLKKFKPKNKRD